MAQSWRSTWSNFSRLQLNMEKDLIKVFLSFRLFMEKGMKVGFGPTSFPSLPPPPTKRNMNVGRLRVMVYLVYLL